MSRLRSLATRAPGAVRETLAFGGVYLVLALISLRVKLSFTPAWFDGRLEGNHTQLMAFAYANNEQSRLLQFAIPELFHRLLDLSIIHAYILQRWLFVFLVFLCFHHYLRRWFETPGAFAGVLFFAAVMPLAFVDDLQESTPLLLLTFLLALWALRDHRTGWYTVWLTLGALNNETMLILPLAFVLYRFEGFGLRALGRLGVSTLATSLPAYLVVGTIRYLTWDHPRLAAFWQWPGNLAYFSHNLGAPVLDYWQASYIYILFIFGMFWIYAVIGYGAKPLFLRRVGWMVPVFIVAHLMGGMISEVRLMLPLGFIVIPLALCYLFPARSPDQDAGA